MPKVIGVTGGIATGKSTVTRYLKKKGYTCLDADEISHQALTKGTAAYHQIISQFDVLEGSQISRKKLGAIVFHDDDKRKQLENIIHPYVYQTMKESIRNSHEKMIFLDVPLLFEAHFDQLCDLTVVVSCLEEIEIKRFMERNHYSYEEAVSRIRTQMSLSEKEKKANYVIDNSDGLDHLYDQVDHVLKEVIQDL